jgi:hypothetical protein
LLKRAASYQKIADESSARIAAISNLNDGLTTETTQRKSEDAVKRESRALICVALALVFVAFVVI